MGREEHCKQISLVGVGSALCLGHTGFALLTASVLSQSTLLRLQVAVLGNFLGWALGCVHFPEPGQVPRSTPLRFRFSGTPQRHRLSWACVLCPSQVQAAQVTRCLVSAVSPDGECILSPPWSQPLSFLGSSGHAHLRCYLCLFWGADLWLQPSQWMSTVQNPKKSWLTTGNLLAV